MAPYDRDSFLAGVAAGRNMESWPAFEGSEEKFTFLCGRGVLRITISCEEGLLIDWGDGTKTTLDGRHINYATSHSYSTTGDYYATITGDLGDIYFYWKYTSGSMTTRNTTALKSVLTPFPRTMSNKTDCNDIFYYSSIVSVIPGLFSKMPNVTAFRRTFEYTPFSVIPENLFVNNPLATDFFDCFRNSGIKDIPEGLFASCVNAVSFTNCFENCNSLLNVPGGLFSHNLSAVDFSNCFNNCWHLATVGEGLFYNNLLAENFQYCFHDDDSLQYVGGNMFQAGGAASDFTMFMSGCDLIGYPPSTSGVPELWTMYPDAAHSSAFSGCSHASNWYQVPVDWGGPT